MAKSNKIAVGSTVFVTEGKRYTRFGGETKIIGRQVTIRDIVPDKRSGKQRIFWKSMGYKASTLV